jgi:hypothetical protein
MTVTVTDKLQCAERELKYRQRIYERLVERGKMTKRQCDRELELMQAIADDYRKLAAQKALL